MATFTIQLKDVIEEIFGTSMDCNDWEQQYHSVSYKGTTYGRLPYVDDWSKLGLGTYPLFDEAYRDVLNGKILDEYFNQEIGTETIDNWLLVIRKKMDQIMPYYNQLYLSEQIVYDPLVTIDIETDASGTGQENTTSNAKVNSTSDNTSGSRAVSQELPQTTLAGIEDYATAATDTNSKSNVEATSNQDNTAQNNTNNTNTSKTKGMQAIAPELIMRYRNTMLNIDVRILGEIQTCFMLVLNNGDAYTQRGWY